MQFFPNISNLWLVESMDAEPMYKKGRLHFISQTCQPETVRGEAKSQEQWGEIKSWEVVSLLMSQPMKS
jgi:hypothetical protein